METGKSLRSTVWMLRATRVVLRVLRGVVRGADRALRAVEEETEYQHGLARPDRLAGTRLADAREWTDRGEKPPWLVQDDNHAVEDALDAFAHPPPAASPPAKGQSRRRSLWRRQRR
jgi:hypothetical protein